MLFPASLPSFFTFPILFLILFAISPMAQAPCPPIFFAQAISHRQMRTMDFYFTKSGVSSAAECANLCGQRHFCQSAIFNHNAHSCALSPSRPVKCRMAKHRFNSFHLTTDGADAISLLACIQHCGGRPEKDKNGGNGGGYSHLLNIDLSPTWDESSKIGGGDEEEFPSPHILPLHDEKSASSSTILEGKNAIGDEQKVGEGDEKPAKGGPSQFLGAIQRLYQMQRRLEQILAEAQRTQEKEEKEAKKGAKNGEEEENAERLPPSAAVHFKAAPLLQMPEGEDNIIPLAVANYSTAAASSQMLTRILRNDTQLRVHSAGFVAKLRPGEKLKLLSDPIGEAERLKEERKNGEEQQMIQLGRTLAVQIPAQLITMAPELFEATPMNAKQEQPAGNPDAKVGEGEEPTVVDGRLLSPIPADDGFLHSLLIHHGKMPKEHKGEDGGALSLDGTFASSSSSSSSSSASSTLPATVICFRFVQHRRLQHGDGAQILMKTGISLNECRCACANTWRHSNRSNSSQMPCKSLRYNSAKAICELLGADHNEKLDLVLDTANDYHYVSCEPKYLLKTADKMCKKAEREDDGKGGGNIKTEQEASSTTLKATNEQLTSTMTTELATTENTETSSSSSAIPQVEAISTTTNNIVEPNDGQKDTVGCFEHIPGHSLRGTAAGLERGVSMAECECLCANSLRSRMYSFQCASASYFHADRDCILNLDNRHTAPDNFVTEQQQQEVTYLGLLCPPERAIASFLGVPVVTTSMLITACTLPSPTQEATTSSSDPSSSSSPPSSRIPPSSTFTSVSASLSDSCFLEQPGFVLEGLALAVETQISAIQCKCQCALADRRHGTACQSAQFYADSQTCLLNSQNRASAPERFSFDEKGQNRHSYLDFRCNDGVDAKLLADYLAINCAVELAEFAVNKTSTATTTIEGAINDETTTVKLKLLGKGKRKKGRKEPQQQQKEEESWKNTTETILAQNTTTTSRGIEGRERDGEGWENAKIDPVEEAKMEVRTAIPSTLEMDAKMPEMNLKLPELNLKMLEFGSKLPESGSKLPEFDSKIPELEGAEDLGKEGEEDGTSSKGWKTVRVQRGDTERNVTEELVGQPQADPIVRQIREQEEKNETINSLPTSTISSSSSQTSSSSSMPNISNSSLPSSTVAASMNNSNTTTFPPSSSNNITSFSNTTTTSPSKTTSSIPEYAPVGQCRFSALYQTVFNGARLLKRLLVESPAQCLAACHWENCRSANLIQMEDKQKVCELFRDSIVEFRRNDVLSFDRLAVHFDSVQCKSRIDS